MSTTASHTVDPERSFPTQKIWERCCVETELKTLHMRWVPGISRMLNEETFVLPQSVK